MDRIEGPAGRTEPGLVIVAGQEADTAFLGVVFPVAGPLPDQRLRVIGTELQGRGPDPVLLPGPHGFPLAADGQAEADAGRVEEALRLRLVRPGQVFNIREPEVPAPVHLRRLREAPQVVHAASDPDFDVDRLSAHVGDSSSFGNGDESRGTAAPAPTGSIPGPATRDGRAV